MAEHFNKPKLDRVIILSDSEERAPLHPTSHPERKHPLNSPQSTTPKRPRIQPQPTTPQSLHLTNSSEAPAPGRPAADPHTQPANSSPPHNVPGKPDDIPSPLTRRKSPSTRSKHSEPHPENNQPHSDEEEPPLDLAKISSYEYEQVAKLNPLQLRRYEQYRRSDLKNAKVRRLILAISPTSKPTEPYVIAVKGLAKLFVGDIVETALQVKKRLADKGALQPRHIREAYRRLRQEGAVPFNNQKDDMLH